jgi:hypothetical protein
MSDEEIFQYISVTFCGYLNFTVISNVMLCYVMMNPLTYYNKIPPFGPSIHSRSKLALRHTPSNQFFNDVTYGTPLNNHWRSDGQYSLHLQDEVDEDLPVTIYYSTSRNSREHYNFNQHSRENLKFRTNIPTRNYRLTTGKHSRQRTPSNKQLRGADNLRCTVKINIT